MTEKSNWKLKDVKVDEGRFLAAVILLMAIVLGTIARWNFISGSEFPINDGGLFYSLIADLGNNKFKLTEFTSYNAADIPNAYPPLAFYLVGSIKAVTGIPVMALLLYLPFVISVLTIPVFYAVTKIFFSEDQISRAIAVYLFATLPRSFEWFVMGGGITRSLGFIFALAALVFYCNAISKKKIGIDLVLAGIFSCLTILSHPVAGIFLAFSIILMTVYLWPVKLIYPLAIGIVVIAGSSPWWTSVISHHGISPFIGAANTGHRGWIDAGYLLTLNFGFENRFFLPVVSFLAIMGLFSIRKKESLILGVLVGMGYLFVPRGGVDLLTIYLALLGTLGFSVIARIWSQKDGDQGGKISAFGGLNRSMRVLLICLIAYTFIGAYSYKYIDGKADLHLTAGDHQAMLWVRDNTNKEARVMHLPPASNYQDWWNDYFGEWMPVVTERHSVATVQGYEWLPDAFNQRIEQYIALRSCTGVGAECVENWVFTYENEFDYLLLSRRQHSEIMIANFLDSPAYDVVFQNEDVFILER